MNLIKLLIFLLLSSTSSYAAYDYEYDNNWYITYKNDSNVYQTTKLTSTSFERIPNTDCQLGQVLHKEDSNMNETFSLELSLV